MGYLRGTETVIGALHEAASAAAGSTRFGDGYLEGLKSLVDDIVTQHDDASAAQGAAQALALTSLIERLRSEESWRRWPEVLEAQVPAPLIIVGLPRSGTTALHHLLSMDERFQVLESWILHAPMPRPPRERWEREPAYQSALARSAQAPEAIRKYHRVEAHEADECLFLMAQTFVSNMFGSRGLLPAYDEWFLQADMMPSFARYADQLRLIGAGDSRRWLLKNPSHLFSLPELFTVFPDAQIAQTHRHPAEAIGSVVSLLTALNGEETQGRARREMRMWGEAVRRAEEARAGREDRFVDVDYRRLMRDPRSVVEEIYDRFGLALGDRTRERQTRWLSDHPPAKHGVHRYDPAALGVTEDAVGAHFGRYIDRHGLADPPGGGQ